MCSTEPPRRPGTRHSLLRTKRVATECPVGVEIPLRSGHGRGPAAVTAAGKTHRGERDVWKGKAPLHYANVHARERNKAVRRTLLKSQRAIPLPCGDGERRDRLPARPTVSSPGCLPAMGPPSTVPRVACGPSRSSCGADMAVGWRSINTGTRWCMGQSGLKTD